MNYHAAAGWTAFIYSASYHLHIMSVSDPRLHLQSSKVPLGSETRRLHTRRSTPLSFPQNLERQA